MIHSKLPAVGTTIFSRMSALASKHDALNLSQGFPDFDAPLALREALDSGCEEALMLDNEGYVAEGSGENFFMVRDDQIYTPELTSCLEGITRGTIFTLAAEMGYTIAEKRITRDEVYIADEAFFTGTAAEVLPIRELDGRRIGDGKRGPLTQRLQAAYFKSVRGASGHSEWLAPV